MIKRRKPTTIGEFLYRRAAFSLIAAGLVMAALVYAGGDGNEIDFKVDPFVVKAEQLRERCEPVAEGTMPGRVLIKPEGATEVRFSKRLVGPALEQIFEGAPTQHLIIDFCV